jgi:hypothetical protein
MTNIKRVCLHIEIMFIKNGTRIVYACHGNESIIFSATFIIVADVKRNADFTRQQARWSSGNRVQIQHACTADT